MDPNYLLKLPPRIIHHAYARRDTMLYALGVGAGQENRDDELRFVYEDGLQALPTMAVVLGYPGYWQKEAHYAIDWRRVLHVEQSVRFHELLPVEGAVRGEFTIDQIIDKGAAKGAILYAKRQIYNAVSNSLLATVSQVSYLRGDGGSGGSTDAKASIPHPIPDRPPDVIETFVTRPEQALLYRLSGDYNPVHAHPQVAREAQLPQPILHGLATYGFAGRAVLRAFCANDPARLKQLDCRFTAPVIPGDTLEALLWNEGQGHVAFQIRVPDRGVLAINNGFAELGV
ncbi:MAG: MaoC family dehydratase [Rhodospirillaceae bacterium]|nr:MAG: MaoC family dehydratase [Rhodospirillaceae bacterium]